YPFQYEIFSMYNAQGNLLQLAVDYYGIRAIGFPITLATFTVFGVFRGFQNTTWAMFISIGGGILNIILDFALIFGIEGIISPMGVKGAALASLMSQIAMLASALIVLKVKLPHSFEFSLIPNKHLSPLVGMTSNLFIRTMALNITYYLGNMFATGYGNAYIAAHTIAMNIWLFSAFFIDGYANAGNAISGRLLGQNNIGALYKTGIKIIKISVLISLILSAVYILLYNVIGMAFTDDTNVRTIFYSIFWMVILTQPINAIAFSLDGIFKGLAKAKLLRNVLLLSTFLVFIPTIYLTDMANINLYAVWLAFLVWMIARGGCLFYYFKKCYASGVTT
ncbi:MAG: MATE family efflux transporter, partial [Bacteroidia bacterium]|nr:MATE family efflux transporter [Bacteroidia bacterium]